MKYRSIFTAILALSVLTSCSSGSSDSSSETAATATSAATSATVAYIEPSTTSAETVTTTSRTVTSEVTTVQTSTESGGFDISGIRAALPDVSVTLDGSCYIYVSGSVNGRDFSLNIDLSKWNGNTSPEQITTLSELFWECYPRMYERFGTTSAAPTDVVLAIEDEGYSPAECSGNFVHLHDQWLADDPTDFDCITHELAHVIQNCWDEENCEYSSYIERFADFCRYEYAFRDGLYNDHGWTLWTPDHESDISTSNRFFVWLDYTYSTPSNDIMLNFFRVCCEGNYTSDRWDEAWQEIFAGSELEGRTINEVWEEFVSSDFAYLSAYASTGTSELLTKYDVRGKIA